MQITMDFIWLLLSNVAVYIGGAALINWRLSQIEKRLEMFDNRFLSKDVADERYRQLDNRIKNLEQFYEERSSHVH